MEVITITSEAFRAIIDKIDQINDKLDSEKPKFTLTEYWLDVQEVCHLLKISKRTLQKYRDAGELPFSHISGKIYYKAADIKKHLETNYKKLKR